MGIEQLQEHFIKLVEQKIGRKLLKSEKRVLVQDVTSRGSKLEEAMRTLPDGYELQIELTAKGLTCHHVPGDIQTITE